MPRVGRDCPPEQADLQPGRAQFPRRVRLTRPAEYQRVFDHCRCKAGNRWMTVLAAPNDRNRARIGMIISRRSARRAVERNRIKRQIRESFRHWQSRLDRLDIVLIARSGIALQSNRVLAQSLERIWRRLIATCAGS